VKAGIVRAVDALGYRVEKRAAPRKNPYFHLSAWEHQKAIVEPRIPAGSAVLDVGSGHDACPRASVLADFFPGDTVHRDREIREDRPLVVCSVERLPFLKGAFDFVICSHVLEHVDSPLRAAEELARVARAGYVETPAYGKDIWVGTGHMHRWQVVEFEGALYFFEYSQRQREAHVASPVMGLWAQPDFHPWQEFYWDRQDLFNACLLWEGRLPAVEHRRAGGGARPVPAWLPVAPDKLPGSPPALAAGEIGQLEKCLATPDGLRPMRFAGEAFVDETRAISYPVRGKRVYCELGG
jgi:SAM-dependent methyltransferase